MTKIMLLNISIIVVILSVNGCGSKDLTQSETRYCNSTRSIGNSFSENASNIHDLQECESVSDENQIACAENIMITFFDLPGNMKFGPREKNYWMQGGDAWCALNAGFNIEVHNNIIVDIWDEYGNHYTLLGDRIKCIYIREWRKSWSNNENEN